MGEGRGGEAFTPEKNYEEFRKLEDQADELEKKHERLPKVVQLFGRGKYDDKKTDIKAGMWRLKSSAAHNMGGIKTEAEAANYLLTNGIISKERIGALSYDEMKSMVDRDKESRTNKIAFERLESQKERFIEEKKLPYVELDHLSDSDVEKVERILSKLNYPGGSDYLGGESFKSIIKQDAATLQELGLTHEDIARAIFEFIYAYEKAELAGELAKDKVGEYIEHDGYYVSRNDWRSYEDCPFESKTDSEHVRTRFDYLIQKIDTKDSIKFGGLMPHLIAEHHFFEGGKDNPYRVDPRSTAQFLNIQHRETNQRNGEEPIPDNSEDEIK